MKMSEWSQRALVVSKDVEILKKISSAFGKETELIVVNNTQQAIDKLGELKINVLVIDANCTDPDLHYSENSTETSFLEITQFAKQTLAGITIVVLVNAMKADDGMFATKSGASLIMDRKDFSVNRMVYVIRVLRQRSFRTLLSRDFVIGQSFPVNIYHYLSIDDRFAVILPKDTPFTAEKKSKIISRHSRHLYVKEDDLEKFFSFVKNSKLDYFYSKELATVRQQYQSLIIQVFDVATDGLINYGKQIVDLGMDIVARLKAIITHFTNPLSCLVALPYPRWSGLAHGINCAIYSLVFAKVCQIENGEQIAFAALIHNFGTADVDQNILKKKESDLLPEELAEYKKHISKTVEILHQKRMVVSPIVEKIIKEHHENFDGTGFPEGLAGTHISMEVALMSLVGSFDYFNTVRVGEQTKDIFEAWAELKKYHASSTLFNKKFNPVLLDKIDKLMVAGAAAGGGGKNS